MRNISKSSFYRLPIPLPPLPEQTRIATCLSTWDRAITTTRQLLEQLETRKKGLMQRLLTGEVRLPGFEGEWETIKLGSKMKCYSGGTPSSNNTEYYDGNIPWISSGELNQKSIITTKKFISEKGLKNSSAKVVPSNSLLLAMYGATAGVVAITKIEGAINQAVLCIEPNINKEYLYFWLDLNMENIVSKYTQGGQPNLSANIIKSINIQAAKSDIEQAAIATVLTTADKEITGYKDKLATLETQKRGLMQQLLTGQKRLSA